MTAQMPSCAQNDCWIRAAIMAGMLLPFFFLLSGRVYNSDVPLYDSGGRFDSVPLPLSLAVCLAGIAIFLKYMARAKTAGIFVSAFVVVLAISGFAAADAAGFSTRKAILAAQFLLPTMGLILGQLINDDDQLISKVFFCILAVFVPMQLLAGWWQGTLSLTHHLYLFSIYQHFQFVPVIFVAAYCLVLGSPAAADRRNKLALMLVMGIYTLSSASYLALGLFGMGTLAYLVTHRVRERREPRHRRDFFRPLLVGGLIVGTILATVAGRGIEARYDEGQLFGKFSAVADGKLPLNVSERLEDWSRFGAGVAESGMSLLFGHAEPLPREVRTSAHNWYLDLAYNFGAVALLPIGVLIAVTMFMAWCQRARLESHHYWLLGIVLFLVLVDANFKVMLRQPYPGLFSYFLWGVLLSKLQRGARQKLVGGHAA